MGHEHLPAPKPSFGERLTFTPFDWQGEELRKKSKETGEPISNILRRAITKYLKEF